MSYMYMYRPANLWESKTVFCDPKNCIFPPKTVFYNKKPYFEVKKSIFARGARITSAKSFRPGSRDLTALEAHGF